MAFPVDFIERLKSANPIAEVMGEYVQTKRAGRDYVCLCPFHNEKTPSCYIHPDREFFHCFGCGAGGDVITFIMKYRNLDYLEAIKYLAERANMEVPLDSYGGAAQNGTRERRQRMYEMNKEAAKFFYSGLSTDGGRKCVQYLMQTRGLSVETIKRYRMGYAPNSWSALKKHMTELGYSEKELEEASLISRSKNNTKKSFDFFVDRAMFPFYDLTGHIVGFGGRTLGDDKRKYLNSRDTLVYNKNRFLFSMNIAKNAAVKSRQILLCEGNLDVISLTQAGFENAVASCGTALTSEQVRLISSYADEVVICYDSDEAGQKATRKAIDLLSAAGLKTRVLTMNGAKDPDEFIRKFGRQTFESILNMADGSVNYELKRAESQFDMESDTGKLGYKDAALAIITKLDSPVERDLYGHKVAEKIGVSFAVLEAEMKRFSKKRYYAEKKRELDDTLRFAGRQDKVNHEAASHPREATSEEYIISYLMNNPDYYSRLKDTLPPEKFVTEFNRKVYRFIIERMAAGEDWTMAAMNESFGFDELGSIAKISERCRAEGIDEQTADDCVGVLLNYKPKQSGDITDDDLLALRQQMRKKNNIV